MKGVESGMRPPGASFFVPAWGGHPSQFPILYYFCVRKKEMQCDEYDLDSTAHPHVAHV